MQCREIRDSVNHGARPPFRFGEVAARRESSATNPDNADHPRLFERGTGCHGLEEKVTSPSNQRGMRLPKWEVWLHFGPIVSPISRSMHPWPSRSLPFLGPARGQTVSCKPGSVQTPALSELHAVLHFLVIQVALMFNTGIDARARPRVSMASSVSRGGWNKRFVPY